MKNKGLENSIKRTYLYVKSLAHRGQKAYNHCSNVPDIALTLRPVAGSEPMKDGYTGGGREGSAHSWCDHYSYPHCSLHLVPGQGIAAALQHHSCEVLPLPIVTVRELRVKWETGLSGFIV